MPVWECLYGHRYKIVRKEAKYEFCGKNLQKDIDFASDQVYVGCTQREATGDPQAVHSKTELFKTLTTTRESEEKDQTNEKYSLEKITAWSYDVDGHAEKTNQQRKMYLPSSRLPHSMQKRST